MRGAGTWPNNGRDRRMDPQSRSEAAVARLSDASHAVGPQRTDFVNQGEEQFTWIVQQLEELVDKFKPFLKLEDNRKR